jgi:hypothetical protein
MKKRYGTLAGFLATSVCLTLATLAMLPPRPGVTKANFDRIKIGMAEEDVFETFGKKEPAGAYPSAGGSGCVWNNDDGSSADIEFDLNFKVRKTSWSTPTEGIGEKLCRWIRWPWW